LTVREGVRISEPRYSLKNLEVFYGGDRAAGIVTALDSMVVYDRWQQTGNMSLLEEIRAYNEADCRSLVGCQDYLAKRRSLCRLGIRSPTQESPAPPRKE
jgi:uncharacterized protein